MLQHSRSMKTSRRPGDGFAKSAGDSLLGEEINLFESDAFDPERFVQSKCQSMSEKNIRRLCVELAEHKRHSAQEMQRSVYANYKAFIRTAREISDLEGELRSMEKLLATQTSLIQSLVETPPVVDPRDPFDDVADYEDEEPDFLEYESRLQALPDALDVALAERKFDTALRLLQQGEELVKAGTLDPRSHEYVAGALSKRRLELTEQLGEVAMQPSVRGPELRLAVGALNRLGEGPRAHTLLLQSHGQRLRIQIQPMRPSGTSYGGAYTAAVTQLVFSALSQAARDSAAVFGNHSAYASELVLWACAETEWCAELLKRHVLSAAASTGGMRSAAECVQIALGHCQLLEEQGLALGQVLTRLVRPSVEQALEGNIRRMLDSVTAMAAADDWYLQPNMMQGRLGRAGGSASHLRLTSSAQRLFSMVQEFLEDVVPIVTMQLIPPTLEGLLHLYEEYMAMLNQALVQEETSYDGDGGYNVQRATDEKQQLALIGNALILSEELPRLAVKLTATPEKEKPAAPGLSRSDSFRSARSYDKRSAASGSGASGGGGDVKRLQLQPWKKQMVRSVDSLRLAFCSQKATDLLYPDEGQDPKLPSLYFFMDQEEQDPNVWRQNPMPSQPMQQFFWTTLAISRAASEVLVGRERMVLQLLTQFAIALLTLVCHAEMWEDSRYFVGPIGLQQFLLDMHFLKEVAVKYHYGSRQLQQIADTSMERAKEAFNVGEDLLEDEGFRQLAQDSILRLSQSGGGDQEMLSPRSHTGSIHSDEGR